MIGKGLSVVLICWGCWLRAEPEILYLTWREDPKTTMVVQWIGKEEGLWVERDGKWNRVDGQVNGEIHTVDVRGLNSGQEYRFKVGEGGQVHLMRTLGDDEVRFVVGGDIYESRRAMAEMNGCVSMRDPDFVVLAGDIAYAYPWFSFGKVNEMAKWRAFLKDWTAQMVGKNGRVIPILPLLGNHDIKGVDQKLDEIGFFNLFALPEKGIAYRVFDWGDRLSLILLDTGHYSRIGGVQAEWLQQTLSDREGIQMKLAIYHVAAYPSVYQFEAAVPRTIRGVWCPLFEQYGVKAAFEHHNHAYKRTYPIKNEKIDPSGVIYFGDGGWGVTPRTPKTGRWYLEEAAKLSSVFFVTIDENGTLVEAMDNTGEIFDSRYLNQVPDSIMDDGGE